MRLAWFRNLPVTVRVPLVVAGLMIVLGLVASQGVLAVLGSLQDARLREITRLHVEGLSVALGPFVPRQDVWEVYDVLDRAQRATDGQRLLLTLVADDQGRVLAATDPRRAPVGSAIAPFTVDAAAPEAVRMTGQRVLRIAAPLVYQDRNVGQIVTELDVTDLLQERRRVGHWLLVGNVAATALLGLAGWLVVARLLRPIGILVEAMGAETGVPHAIPDSRMPRGDPGLVRLFRTYNAMAAAAEARAEAERRLAARERFVSLGRLSSSLAHEINNPLGGLMNSADTIASYAHRPEVVREAAGLIQRGLSHLRDVSRAILDQNRLDRAQQPLCPEDLDDLRLLFGPEAASSAQSLDWRVAADAAALGRHPAAPVRQILLNLLLNAGAAAGRSGHVALDVRSGPDGLHLVVADSGPGLSTDDLARLMASGPVPPGGGVGLRLVHDLVTGLGGEIRHARSSERTAIEVVLPTAGGADA
ncbi:sensor histidine kinase [Paracoccus spongiarum]|uniref:histidine kinase n=1 Tax=Paracoccus spongiarum TaxID=3064387 RepID=A0ABT9JAN8_9RHOB|nr:ATP-binding protein [Paracoccus sp. 2205BS29-5]MDP5306166.1 ATP-binding protein [Paracoccus sp. 2205BS29-5]